MNERKELRKARAKEARDAKAVDTAVGALLHSPDGRAYLWWMLEITRYGQTPYTGNALATAFNCGELNIGQQLLARIMEVDPEGFLNLLKEKNDERRSDEPRDDDIDDD